MNIRIVFNGLSDHFLERLFERYTSAHKRVVEEVTPLADFLITKPKQGMWEVGTGHGMAIVQVKKDRLSGITWVDLNRLSPDQPAEAGQWRRIENLRDPSPLTAQ